MAVRFFKLLVIKCLFHGRSEENVSRGRPLNTLLSPDLET